MGVDYLYCRSCDECFHSDCFRQCICGDKINLCNGCDENHLVKEKDFDIDLYNHENPDDKIEFSSYEIYMGKSEKPKTVRKRIFLCEECIERYVKIKIA